METVNDPQSIETIVCKPFEALPCYPMSQEQTALLIRLLLNEPNEIPEKDKPFLYAVIEKRVNVVFDYKISDSRLLLFLAVLTKSPGTAVLYLTFLQYYCKTHKIEVIDLTKFCEIFPIGFPSEEELSKIWKAQKVNAVGSDNLVDHYKTAGKSIQFEGRPESQKGGAAV